MRRAHGTSSILRTLQGCRRRRTSLLAGFLVCCLGTLLFTKACVVSAHQDEHVVASQNRQEVGATATNPFVGTSKCLACHQWVAPQQRTGMGMAALDPAAPSKNYQAMRYRSGQYTTALEKTPQGLAMTTTDGQNSLGLPVRWIFGQGRLGQTFILEREGTFYESRASYYSATEGLDLTLGHSPKAPLSLLASLGRPLPANEVVKCFSCHTSEDVFEGKLEVGRAHPGVTCERCHGAGGEHVASLLTATGKPARQDAAIFNPGTLPPADVNDFCGTCHRTTHDVLQSGVRDVRNVRFQPYRLENSRCYDPSDARITCIACHDPHRDLEVSARSYDSKCLACHATRGQAVQAKAVACPRADNSCVTCHMPKTELPGAHYSFTDHYIRVAQPGAPYPE